VYLKPKVGIEVLNFSNLLNVCLFKNLGNGSVLVGLQHFSQFIFLFLKLGSLSSGVCPYL
jgi:hypothetical protein